MGKLTIDNAMGEIINQSRMERELTQDEFGMEYGVSGPAIFKFEKGYVRPSVRLWMPIAKDAGLDECTAIRMWVRGKVPAKYRHHVTLGRDETSANGAGKKRKGKPTFAQIEAKLGRTAMLQQAVKVGPRGFKKALLDEQFVAVFDPDGGEVDRTLAFLDRNGPGKDHTAREVFRLVRDCGRG